MSNWVDIDNEVFCHYFNSFGADVNDRTKESQSLAYQRKLKDNVRYQDCVYQVGMTAININNAHWILVVLVVTARL